MARTLDAVLVVDIESTCWKRHPPQGQQSEIIEIGLCLLDVTTGEWRDKRSILIKPGGSTVSEFCTLLTSLTQEQVDIGIPFKQACEILINHYNSRNRVWASFGDYDRRMFEYQCQARSIQYPFGKTHINVKALFALRQRLPKEVGMETALEHLNIPLEGRHHRGDDDAWNTAKILAALLFEA